MCAGVTHVQWSRAVDIYSSLNFCIYLKHDVKAIFFYINAVLFLFVGRDAIMFVV